MVQRDPSHFQRKQLTPQIDEIPEARTLQGDSKKADLQITYSAEGDVNRSPSSLNTANVVNNIKGR